MDPQPPPPENPEPPPAPPRPDSWYGPPDGGGPPDYGDFEGARDGPAWEHREELGIITAAGRTVREVLMEPGETFARARREGGIGNPMLYALFMALTFGTVSVFISQATNSSMSRLSEMAQSQAGTNQQAAESALTVLQRIPWWISLIVLPFAAVLGPLIHSLILHVCLMMTGGAKSSYEATYRVSVYTFGSVMPLTCIPFCGGIISSLWSLVATIIGLAAIHETDTWRAVVAVFLPLLLTCCCIGIAIFAFGAIFIQSQ